MLLLIAPLWNWNYTALHSEAWAITTFNRTFMELKQEIVGLTMQKEEDF